MEQLHSDGNSNLEPRKVDNFNDDGENFEISFAKIFHIKVKRFSAKAILALVIIMGFLFVGFLLWMKN